jgi:phytoene/squalene synthetase
MKMIALQALFAESITESASKQTYYTIRFLVDRERVANAYRAYAYFRWVDDTLDEGSVSATKRLAFLEREKSLLVGCFQGHFPRNTTVEENMLIELVRGDQNKNSGLQLYLRNMMQVMDFDAMCRGKLISQAELNEYTRWLATAVTEAMHYFIGTILIHRTTKPVILLYPVRTLCTCYVTRSTTSKLVTTIFHARCSKQIILVRKIYTVKLTVRG